MRKRYKNIEKTVWWAVRNALSDYTEIGSFQSYNETDPEKEAVVKKEEDDEERLIARVVDTVSGDINQVMVTTLAQSLKALDPSPLKIQPVVFHCGSIVKPGETPPPDEPKKPTVLNPEADPTIKAEVLTFRFVYFSLDEEMNGIFTDSRELGERAISYEKLHKIMYQAAVDICESLSLMLVKEMQKYKTIAT